MWSKGVFRRFVSLPTRTNSHGSEEKQRTTPMEKEAPFPNDFPTDGVALRCFLVVSDYTRSLAFYRDVLGATGMRELAGTLCILSFAGSQSLLSAPAGSANDNLVLMKRPARY